MPPVHVRFHERKTSKGQRPQVMLQLFGQLPLETRLPIQNSLSRTQLWSFSPHLSPHSTPKRPSQSQRKKYLDLQKFSLCTEPKDTPAEALQFAIVFEDGLKRQKTYGYIGQEPKRK